MREVYRKFGRAVRRENAFLIRVDEAGEAVEDGGMFRCSPIDEARDVPAIDTDFVHSAAASILGMVRPPLSIERLIVSEGVALHEYGDERWSERSRRVHVSIARGPYRALVDCGDFSATPIARACEALARVDGERTVKRLRLANHVGAALLPSLIGRIAMQQWAAPHDGKGAWIANAEVGSGPPPNWFRPSYRVRPLRAWFHLRAEPKGEIDRDLPEAVALLAPVHNRTLRLLCIDGSRAFVTAIEATDVLAAAPSENWYPYAAGCFGAEMML